MNYPVFYSQIYVHRMTNTTMFGPQKFYEDGAFWEENLSVYPVSEDTVGCYDIFAALPPGQKTGPSVHLY